MMRSSALVLRLFPDGTIDPSYGSAGVAAFETLTFPSSIRLDPQGNGILCATAAGNL
jgi:hypothetical protein